MDFALNKNYNESDELCGLTENFCNAKIQFKKVENIIEGHINPLGKKI